MTSKIAMTLLVRNEEDIIADNIWFHHAQGVDSFIITDNLSTDATADIIRGLSREVEIEYIYQPDDDYSQANWVNEMIRRACSDDLVDWVINSDADEFWKARTGTLKSYLSKVPAEVGVLNVRRHNAILTTPDGGAFEATCHPRRDVVFERDSVNSLGAPLPGKCLHRAFQGAVVTQGNHQVSGVPGKTLDVNDSLQILHYPYRSFAQYKRKIALGGAAYSRNTDLPAGTGITWREQYKGIETGAVERFWENLVQPTEETTIHLAMGNLFRDTAVATALAAPARVTDCQPRQSELTALRKHSEIVVQKFARKTAEPIAKVKREARAAEPLYHYLKFALRGPYRQLEFLKELEASQTPEDLSQRFGELRDAYSLFPRNKRFKDFFGELLSRHYTEAVARLRADCAGKRVILHLCCRSRMHHANLAAASFAELGSEYQNIILVGEDTCRNEDETALALNYVDGVLTVPIADNYENLHRKLFYALTILDLVADPISVVKIDDDVFLEEGATFDALLDKLLNEEVEYAGKAVGSTTHERQWHGWHLEKCGDPLVEARGYQYPLPRKYIAGGFGVFLGRRAIKACSYMYLAMKEFFAMRAVGLEDVWVGHAQYAQGIEPFNLATPDCRLSMPGLGIGPDTSDQTS